MRKLNFWNFSECLYIGSVCLTAIVVMIPIVIFGIPEGNDLPQHYQFAQTYYDSLLNGNWSPSWSPAENFGYGGIGIRFYPPLAYYVLVLARILVGNWFDASWLTFMFWMVTGCLGIYFWARHWLFAREAAIAGIIYAFIPYHLTQLYTSSFMYADFAGAAILPFCFAFLTKVASREKSSDVLGLAVSFAFLVLTHLPTTITGSFSLAFYGLLLLSKRNSLKQLARASTGIAIGIALSAFYWLPMVTEMRWLNHATNQYSTGHYGFAGRFSPTYIFPSTVKDFNPLVTDFPFLVCLLLLAFAMIYFFYRYTNKSETDEIENIFKTVLPIGLFSIVMTTPFSLPLWNILEFLQKIQFPQRWLSVAAMCSSVIAAGSIHYLTKDFFFRQRGLSYGILILATVIFLFNCVYIWNPQTSTPIDRAAFEKDISNLPSKKSFICWWAIWAKPEALIINQKISVGNRFTAIENWQSEKRAFFVSNGSQAVARVSTFYYPYWKATVNDIPTEIGMDENGVILIPIPAQNSQVRLFFQEPAIIKIASVISILCWIFLITIFLHGCWRRLFVFPIH